MNLLRNFQHFTFIPLLIVFVVVLIVLNTEFEPSDESHLVADGEKYLVVRCDKEFEGSVDCGGWGDRLKAIVSGYWLAQLTNRTLLIQMTRPCELAEIFEPSEARYDWRIKWSRAEMASMKKKVLQLMNPRHYRETLETTTKLRGYNDNIPLIVLLTNRNFAEPLSKNKNQFFVDSFRRLGVENQTLVDMKYSFADIYKKLFKLRPQVQEKYDKFVRKAKPHANSTLICIHVRLGHHKDERNDKRKVDVTYQLRSNTRLYWDFARRMYIGSLTQKNQPYKVFLNTDTEDVYEEALHEFGADVLVTNEGGYFNIDLISQRDDCSSVEKTYLDFHAFELCDVSIITHSQFSKLGLWRLDESKRQRPDAWVYNRNLQEFLPIHSVYDFQIE